MNIQDIIRKKQTGKDLSAGEILYFIEGVVHNAIPDYQIAALLMAIYFKGMTIDETYFLTRAMVENSDTLSDTAVSKFRVDKHSTGGVGDKVSIMLVPLLVSSGLCVPMISGRGLGHSGGTLDKLESIPGFRTALSKQEADRLLSTVGAVFLGQSERFVPADKKIYALRDLTSTIKSVPLITSSILSKKIVENLDALVLDIKIGRGAFFGSISETKTLVTYLNEVARRFQIKLKCIYSAMDQPLGYSIGNWLEIKEVIASLRDRHKGELYEITMRIAAELLNLVTETQGLQECFDLLRAKIDSGEAYEKLLEIIDAQGGVSDYIRHPEKYTCSVTHVTITSKKSGYIKKIDAYDLGMLSMEIGAGRQHIEDAIDPRAGILLHAKIGDYVRQDEPLLEIFTDQKVEEHVLRDRIAEAFTMSERKVKRPGIILNVPDHR